MEKQVIIALGREFGSGGHYVGEKVAKDLGLHYYDRKILEHIAEEKNIHVEKLEKYDEKKGSKLFSRSVNGFSNSLEEIVAEMQFDYLRKKAESGESFVIVGRCAEEIFRGDERLISVFVLSDLEDKIKRVSEHHGIRREDAMELIRKKDKSRKRYHNKYSSVKWGDSRGYDMCINSAKLGIEGTAALLEQFIKARTGLEFQTEKDA